MTFICSNKKLPTHIHELVEEYHRCVQPVFAPAKVQPPAVGAKLDLIKGIIDMVPDGYYATQADDTATMNFMRLSRPTRGKFKGTLKVQTQHSERWENALVRWSSGNWSCYDSRIYEIMMLCIADHHSCARRYSIELQTCCVCNTQLTDDRSRHYLIGPICDKKPYWQWVIEEVDDKNGGLSYEDLVARGLPTRVWQEQEKKNLGRSA